MKTAHNTKAIEIHQPKSVVYFIETEAGRLYAKGSKDVLLRPLVTIANSTGSDRLSLMETEKVIFDLVGKGYNILFPSVGKDDLWAMNAVLKAGGQAAILSYKGMDDLMHEQYIPLLKDPFLAGQVLFLSYRLKGTLSTPEERRRNQALTLLSEGLYSSECHIKQITDKFNHRQWQAMDMTYPILQEFIRQERPVFMPAWTIEQHWSNAVLLRMLPISEVASGEELVSLLEQRQEVEQFEQSLNK